MNFHLPSRSSRYCEIKYTVDLLGFPILAGYFQDKIRAKKKTATETGRDSPVVLQRLTSYKSSWTYQSSGAPQGAVPYILDVTVVL
jgi:hypothetical protein